MTPLAASDAAVNPARDASDRLATPLASGIPVAHARSEVWRTLRDLVTLTKPRITLVVLITAAGGMKLAPGSVAGRTWLLTMVGTALVVGAANALNMYLERDVDGKMARTRRRPLPAGRLSPPLALAFGLTLAVVSLPILTFGVNAMTGLLGAIALLSYVLVYTPMKRHSIRALWVGAIPGAIPPLLGWAAATGRIDRAGLALFALLFVWQIPHFLAISMFRREDYASAGLKIVPVEKGERVARWMTLRYSLALVAASLWPVGEHVGGVVYLMTALLLGAIFVGFALRGLQAEAGTRWARGLFAYSILYLVLLFATLVFSGGASV